MTKIIELLGREFECPHCKRKILFSWLSGMAGVKNFFYSTDNNNVLISNELSEKICLLTQTDIDDFVLQKKIMHFLSAYRSKGDFAIWSNIKCPYCHFEFPYRFKGDLKLRLQDSSPIFIDGCHVIEDKDSYQVKVISPQ